MKKIGLAVLGFLVAMQCWGLTLTGMPFLDELRADVSKNGPLSKRLGFSDEQREKIQKYIDEQSETLVKKRDALVEAEKKLDHKQKKKGGSANAKEEKDKAFHALNAAREAAFAGLKAHVTDEQFEALKKKRAAGKID